MVTSRAKDPAQALVKKLFGQRTEDTLRELERRRNVLDILSGLTRGSIIHDENFARELEKRMAVLDSLLGVIIGSVIYHENFARQLVRDSGAKDPEESERVYATLGNNSWMLFNAKMFSEEAGIRGWPLEKPAYVVAARLAYFVLLGGSLEAPEINYLLRARNSQYINKLREMPIAAQPDKEEYLFYVEVYKYKFGKSERAPKMLK